jgi:putative hydrolase of HD superfamily
LAYCFDDLLKEYANEDFDLAKAMVMALIHDIVEIDAGDTYAYDLQELETQSQREEVAANRIFCLLPSAQKERLIDLFREFEEGKTPEARFAHVMDNLQHILLNDYNNGKDWRKHDVSKDKVLNRQKTTQLGSNEIWEFTKELIERNVKKAILKTNKTENILQYKSTNKKHQLYSWCFCYSISVIAT